MEPERWIKLSNQTVVPLGLRWRVTPETGLPRSAFSVWRRPRQRDPDEFSFVETQVNAFHIGDGAYHLPTAPIYVMIVNVRNTDTVRSLTVNALDGEDREIPFQVFSVPPGLSRNIRFQHPFIGGFKCSGAGFQVNRVSGITMQRFSEFEDWKLMETVGLPAADGEISGYSSGPQGYPTLPLDPKAAADMRLKIAQQFYLPLPTTVPGGVTVPTWEIPKPAEALDELRDGDPSLIKRISEMLAAVDGGDPATQALFRSDIVIPGIHQPDFPDHATPDATVNVPLLVTIVLNAVTDPWFALTSGFGTTDFPELLSAAFFVEPVSYFHVSHDYMVSAKFVFRLLGFEFSAEHFALSHRSVLPTLPASGLAAAEFALDRPPRRDDPWSIDAALTWPKTNKLQIQGNAIAVAEGNLTGRYLNPLRPSRNVKKPALFCASEAGRIGRSGAADEEQVYP